MALYLGSKKININLDGATYSFNFVSPTLILDGIKLLSFDDYVLMSSDELYLTAKESE